MDEKAYKKYKKMIARAKSKIDNKPPKLEISVYYKPRNLNIDANRTRQIDKENILMLRRINIITRFGGVVDCWKERVKILPRQDDAHLRKRILRINKMLLKAIRNAETKYPAAEFIKNWKDMRKKLEHSKNALNLDKQEIIRKPVVTNVNDDRCMVRDVKLLKEMNPSSRTKCFFEIEIQKEKEKLGTIHFELYDDILPETCANFVQLCRGWNGFSYKNTPIHRIVTGYWCQGGDVTKFNGIGGTSIHGESFDKENFHLRHSGPGVLSMCSNSDNKNDSKFNLTFRRLDTMNEKHVVFGKIVYGFSNIYKIEEFGTKTGKPIKTIIISNCGVISKK